MMKLYALQMRNFALLQVYHINKLKGRVAPYYPWSNTKFVPFSTAYPSFLGTPKVIAWLTWV